MTDQSEVFVFTDEPAEEDSALETGEETSVLHAGPWKVLIIDDDEAILQTSTRILRDFVFEGRGVSIITGTSAAQAKQLISEHPDTAVMLLDVIMECDDAGLKVVSHIRGRLENKQVRILLRTGQAGVPDEEQVLFEQYDINDFLEKGELTSLRLKMAFKVALRAYRMQAEVKSKLLREIGLRKAADVANNAKSEFLANMSHELLSPMTSIRSGLSTVKEVLLDPEADDEDRADMMQAIDFAQSSSDRLQGQLNDILDRAMLEAGEMEAGKMEPGIQPTDFSEASKLALQEISSQAKEKSLTLKLDVSVADAIIPFDYGKMMQVVIDLFNHAVKFTPEGKEISISLIEAGLPLARHTTNDEKYPALSLIVSDQGVSIPEDELSLIFDKFAHNGRIHVENNPEGGARFIVSLPRGGNNYVRT